MRWSAVPRAKRREARRVQGTDHGHSWGDGRPRGHQARGRRVRRGARRTGPEGRPRVLDGDGPGGARPRASGGAPGVLVRLAHHARRPGRGLVEAQDDREGRRLTRAPRSVRGPRRPGGGVPAGVRQRHAVDRRARQRPRGGREPGPARVEPARGQPHPQEQPHARVDFALFMVEALENDELVHEAQAIVGCQTPSALAHAARK